MNKRSLIVPICIAAVLTLKGLGLCDEKLDADTQLQREVPERNIPKDYEARQPGARGAALAGYGGGSATEAAVLKSLRWMAKNQAEDGSWGQTKPAMTAFALLSFLAHAETPSSEEFGPTVDRAIKFLLASAGDGEKFLGTDGHEYTYPIATYALCEAYGMTKDAAVKTVAEKALERIIKGQHESGGWDYNLKQTAREDTSYMGWCAQALKAGRAAGLDVAGLEEACKLSVRGFQKNYAESETGVGFGYTTPSAGHALSPVGTLCMQINGASDAAEVMRTREAYRADAKWKTYDLDNPAPGKAALYYWYYLTQVHFYSGGDEWNEWNRIFAPELVRKQAVISEEESGYTDHKDMPRAIGYWPQYQGHGSTEGPIFGTCLATLQLEVYYRYLPNFITAR